MHHRHHGNHKHGHRWRRGIGFAALIVAGVAVVTWVVMLLWNALLPSLFGWHSITFWQAAGLLVLGKIFFGGWHRGGRRCHHHDHGGWAHLSEEERQQLRARFARHCCGEDHHDAKPAENSAS